MRNNSNKSVLAGDTESVEVAEGPEGERLNEHQSSTAATTDEFGTDARPAWRSGLLPRRHVPSWPLPRLCSRRRDGQQPRRLPWGRRRRRRRHLQSRCAQPAYARLLPLWLRMPVRQRRRGGSAGHRARAALQPGGPDLRRERPGPGGGDRHRRDQHNQVHAVELVQYWTPRGRHVCADQPSTRHGHHVPIQLPRLGHGRACGGGLRLRLLLL